MFEMGPFGNGKVPMYQIHKILMISPIYVILVLICYNMYQFNTPLLSETLFCECLLSERVMRQWSMSFSRKKQAACSSIFSKQGTGSESNNIHIVSIALLREVDGTTCVLSLPSLWRRVLLLLWL